MLGKVLLLQCRGLGDAVIATGVVNSIGFNFPGTKVDILGREEARPIFEENPHVGRFYAAPFPIAVGLRFSPMDAMRLLKALWQIRREHYDLCINLIGDFRENLIGWLSGSAVQHAPVWRPRHPILRTIRVALSRLVDTLQPIDGELCNIYRACDQIAGRLGCRTTVGQKIYVETASSAKACSERVNPVIGIHPFARQDCRRWQGKNWRALVQTLLLEGYDILLFGSPTDLATAEEWFGGLLNEPRVRIVFGDLRVFFLNLGAADLLIGLDSFAVHVAHALNVPSIMLNGANDPRIWAPPTTAVVEHDHGCPHYPCFNRPKCIGSREEYVCIRSIPVRTVIERVRLLPKRRPVDGNDTTP